MSPPANRDLSSVPEDVSPFRQVADSTYDWETWFAVDGTPIWINPAVARMTGYSVAECLAMKDYPLPMVFTEDHHKVEQLFAKILASTSGNDVEFRVRHRDGTPVWVAVSWQPMIQGGKHLGFRTSIRDITRKQRLREQLRMHAQQLEQLVSQRTERLRQLERKQTQMEKLAALGQLAASVAHEINNPLAGIRNALALVRSDLPADDPHQGTFELIDKEIERMSGIVQQMYQANRRWAQPARQFDLNGAVNEVLYFLASQAKQQQVAVDNRGHHEPALVELPEDEVKQVVYNLLRNAIQASPQGSAVQVAITPDGDGYRLEVTDAGVGIDQADLPSIFEPFYSTKGNDSGGGLGLGLAISQAIMESLGGRIEVRTSRGRGSCFAAVIPSHAPHVENHTS